MPRKRHTVPHTRVTRDRIFNLQQDYRRLRTRQSSLVSQLDALVSQYSNGSHTPSEYTNKYSTLIRKIQSVNHLMEQIEKTLRG
jgi:hypothetical protein